MLADTCHFNFNVACALTSLVIWVGKISMDINTDFHASFVFTSNNIVQIVRISPWQGDKIKAISPASQKEQIPHPHWKCRVASASSSRCGICVHSLARSHSETWGFLYMAFMTLIKDIQIRIVFSQGLCWHVNEEVTIGSRISFH